MLTEIRMPALDGWGYGYQKFNRRSEDWAMVAVSARRQADRRHRARTSGSGSRTWRRCRCARGAVEEALRGQPLNAETIARAAEQAAEGTDPPADLNASADYKRHWPAVLCRARRRPI